MSDIAAKLDEARALIEDALGPIGVLPLDEDWLYTAIRHCQRNMDFDVTEGFNEPDRYAGTHIARLINAMPALLILLRKAADLARSEAVPPIPQDKGNGNG